MKRIGNNRILLLASVLSFIAPFLAAAQITFERNYGGPYDDIGYSAQQTSDGGYIVAGYTNKEPFPFGDRDVFLIRVDSLGDTIWTKTYGNSLEDGAYSVRQCKNGDYIVVGVTYSYSAGNYVSDVFLLKVAPDGDTIWTKTYGGTGWDNGHSVIESHTGGYIIVGETTSYGACGGDVYLVRADSEGNELWRKIYGGSSAQVGEAIQQTDDGGYIITGWSLSDSPDSEGVLLIKTDSVGNMIWEKIYGGMHCAAYSVQQTSDSGYIICGHKAEFGNGGWEVWLLKTNSLGDTVWTRSYGGDSEDWGYSVQQTSDDGYIMAGYTWSYGAGSGDVYLIKTDMSGDAMWTKTYGGTNVDYAYSIQRTADGGYIIVGRSGSYGGDCDVYLIKTDSLGNVLGIEERDELSIFNASHLYQNSPNPFNFSTSICYNLTMNTYVELVVYNIQGQLVRTLVNKEKSAGIHIVDWDAKDENGSAVSSGVYFYQLKTSSGVKETRKMSILR